MFENKGLVIESPGTLKVVNIPLRELETDEVLVRVRYVALCGSDIKLYLGSYVAPHKYPIVIGHEWVGMVQQVGSGVNTSWSIGDVVTGDCSIFCGCCSYCTTNKNHCITIEKKGITQDGGCSQYSIVKAKHIYKCPSLHDVKALALVEPLAVAVQAIINRITTKELKRVKRALIIGSGGIGVMTMFSLLELQIPDITIVDIQSEKLSLVSSFGYANVHTAVVDLAGDTSQLGAGFDLIVEAAGSGVALRKAVELANPCGTIVCVGHQKNVELDFGMVMKKSLSIITSIGSAGGFEQAIKIIEKNHENISKMVTRIVPIDTAEQYFKNELKSSATDLKVLIDLN